MRNEDVFSSIANPVRRRILDLLREGPRAAGEIAEAFEINRPAVSEHLQVLRGVRLVREESRGRKRIYHLDASGLKEIEDWLQPFESYWNVRIHDLGQLLDRKENEQ